MRPDDVRKVACPKCGARPKQRCRSASGAETNNHVAREAAAAPVPTAEELAQRAHEQRQFDEQFSRRTLVTVTARYTCGCVQPTSEPIPISEANVYPGRAGICDEHDEFVVVSGVDVALVADETTMLRILLAADIDPRSAGYVAADQNDTARANRVALGMGGGPT